MNVKDWSWRAKKFYPKPLEKEILSIMKLNSQYHEINNRSNNIA